MIDCVTAFSNNPRPKTVSHAHKRGECIMNENEKRMIEEINSISARGNSAEVKRDKDGRYVIYEVQKKKKTVG